MHLTNVFQKAMTAHPALVWLELIPLLAVFALILWVRSHRTDDDGRIVPHHRRLF